jgi:hypothetical protein
MREAQRLERLQSVKMITDRLEESTRVIVAAVVKEVIVILAEALADHIRNNRLKTH